MKTISNLLAVDIEINRGCNRSCSYCPNSLYGPRENEIMQETLYREILVQLKSVNFKGRLAFHFYNEPLLCPNLEEFIILTKIILPECRVTICTNGTLLTKDKILKLLELGINGFFITKHENSKELPFEKNLSELNEGERSRLKFNSYENLILTNRGGVMNSIFEETNLLPLDKPCYIPTSNLQFTVNGNVLPCFEDYEEKNIMGNVKDNHIIDIWNKQKFVDFREQLKKGNRACNDVCSKCNSLLVLPT